MNTIMINTVKVSMFAVPIFPNKIFIFFKIAIPPCLVYFLFKKCQIIINQKSSSLTGK